MNALRSLRPLALGLVLTACTAPLHAQRPFDLGIKLGVNRDDLANSYAHTPLLGGHIGLFARVKAPLLPGVQAEALLSSMGTHVELFGSSADLRTAVLQVPVFALLSIGPAELHLGGYYTRQLAKDWDLSTDLQVEGTSITLDELNDGTFGLLAGAGVHLGHFYAHLRYNYGLQALGSGPYLGDVKERQVQLSIGWGFL